MKFSVEEIDSFLVNKLKFPEWKSLLEKDKVKFLTEIQRHHMTHVYFQNLSMCAKDRSQWDTPSLNEIIQTGFDGTGGVCFHLNYFLKLLLVSLGFDAFCVKATFEGPDGIPDSHCIVIVNLSSKEKYLLDVASVHPMEEAVPIHNLPYSAKAAGFAFEFRYNYNNDGLYSRHQIGGSFFNGPFQDDTKEQLRFYFTLDPADYIEFIEPMRPIFADPIRSHFLKLPFLLRYTKFTDDEYEFIIICGRNVLIAGRETRNVTKYSSIDDVLPVIQTDFPNLDKKIIQIAFDVFKSFEFSNGELPI